MGFIPNVPSCRHVARCVERIGHNDQTPHWSNFLLLNMPSTTVQGSKEEAIFDSVRRAKCQQSGNILHWKIPLTRVIHEPSGPIRSTAGTRLLSSLCQSLIKYAMASLILVLKAFAHQTHNSVHSNLQAFEQAFAPATQFAKQNSRFYFFNCQSIFTKSFSSDEQTFDQSKYFHIATPL